MYLCTLSICIRGPSGGTRLLAGNPVCAYGAPDGAPLAHTVFPLVVKVQCILVSVVYLVYFTKTQCKNITVFRGYLTVQNFTKSRTKC